MCVMFVYMRFLTEEVAVCKNMYKCMRDKEGMRLWISLHVLCNKKTDLIHALTFTWPLYMFIPKKISRHMRHQSTLGPQWDGSPVSRGVFTDTNILHQLLHHCHSDRKFSQAVLTLVPNLGDESIQQQGNLTNSINSVAARQPINNTESVSLPLPILGQ